MHIYMFIYLHMSKFMTHIVTNIHPHAHSHTHSHTRTNTHTRTVIIAHQDLVASRERLSQASTHIRTRRLLLKTQIL